MTCNIEWKAIGSRSVEKELPLKPPRTLSLTCATLFIKYAVQCCLHFLLITGILNFLVRIKKQMELVVMTL